MPRPHVIPVDPNRSPLPSRFWNKVDKTDECWTWIACTFEAGYGMFWLHGKARLAHRLAYEERYGQLPECLDHLCRNRACVNPEHLEPVTIGENLLRGEAPAAKHARKTHCHRGHPFDEESTRYYLKRGNRVRACRACARENARRYAAEKRAAAV